MNPLASNRPPLDLNLGDLTRDMNTDMRRKIERKQKELQRAEIIRRRNNLLHGLTLRKLDNAAFLNYLISQTKENKLTWFTLQECDYINYKGHNIDNAIKIFSINRNGMVVVCVIDFGKRSPMKISLLNQNEETETVDYPSPEPSTTSFNIACTQETRKELELAIATQYEERLEDMKLDIMSKFIRPTEDDLIDMGLGLGEKKSVPKRRKKLTEVFPWETSSGDFCEDDDRDDDSL